MTHTVTLLADHNGYARPRVSGTEYVVDVALDITAYVAGGVTVTAASCGLSTVTAVLVTGQENLTHSANAVVSTAGAYESSTSFKVALAEGPNEVSGTGDEGVTRLRVYGLV